MANEKKYSEMFEVPTIEHITHPWGKRVSVVEELPRASYESIGVQSVGIIMNNYLSKPEIWSEVEQTGLPIKYFSGQIPGCRYTLECVLFCLLKMGSFDVIAVEGLKKTKANAVVCFRQKDLSDDVYQNICILLSYCIEDFFDIRDIKVYLFNGTKEEVLKGIENHPDRRKIEKILKVSEKRVRKLEKDVILWCNNDGVSYK